MAHPTDGYYEVNFASNVGNVGAGKLTMKDLTISGVDVGFLYDGAFQELKDDEYTGHVELRQHNKDMESVFGDFQTYKLMLKGQIRDGKAELSATMVGQEDLSLSVQMSRVSTHRRPRGF
ncbi:GrlR family regulatory protein [Cognatishimia activa]|uniref:GrlR family regulatory protein n=1 Tax=Cognatishimia activa TaxID=1715691 RepID=UPI002230F1DB|nr:GrlR family regulatory protein [Cognatishimia activa]UZD92304.1 hypothetical protein M0D42_06755 [Cognatishimia activa]